MHMHMFWHAPKLTQPSHRSPGSAMSAESSVENVTNRAAKEKNHFLSVYFFSIAPSDGQCRTTSQKNKPPRTSGNWAHFSEI